MKRKALFLIVLLAVAALACGARSVALADEAENEQSSASEMIEQLDISALEEYFSSLDEDSRALFGASIAEYLVRIAEGNFEFGYSSFFGYLAGALGLSLASVLPMVLTVLASAVLISFVNGMRGSFASGAVGEVVNFAGVALVAALVALEVFAAIRHTASLISSLRTQMEAVFPILFTVMSALGASGSIAVYRPAVAVLTFSVTELVSVVALPMLIVTLAFSIIGNLSNAVKLDGMAKFFASLAKWVMYTSFFLFLAFLSVQGITAAVYDSISVRSAKFALSKYVPVIGGYLSDGFNMILAGAVLVKNSVGVTAIVLLLASVVPVLVEVVAVSLALRLSAALVEPLGCGRVASMLSSVSSSVNLLTAVICGTVFLYFIFLVLLILSGNLVL